LVALLPSNASELGTNSRYLVTLSPKPRPLLEAVCKRLGTDPISGLTIEWPTPFPGRIRNVITRSGAHRRYSVPCYRYGEREAHGDAAEEAASFILLDSCPGVEFQEQPARLTFEWRGDHVNHIPDIFVASKGRCEFWECKRASQANDFWIRKRSERLCELLTPLGIGYRVVTGDTLCRGSFLSNARQLRRFAKRPVSDSIVMEATLRTRAAGAIGLGELAGYLPGDEPLADLLALIYMGTLCADVSSPLTPSTHARLRTEEEEPPWVLQLFAPVPA
jgi:hypothetical protein